MKFAVRMRTGGPCTERDSHRQDSCASPKAHLTKGLLIRYPPNVTQRIFIRAFTKPFSSKPQATETALLVDDNDSKTPATVDRKKSVVILLSKLQIAFEIRIHFRN